jgi:hypothetical protein
MPSVRSVNDKPHISLIDESFTVKLRRHNIIQGLYGYRPLLLETLVDPQFRGTSYRAANWIYVGETRGRGPMDQHHEAHGRAVKRIYIYPLCRDVKRLHQTPPRDRNQRGLIRLTHLATATAAALC